MAPTYPPDGITVNMHTGFRKVGPVRLHAGAQELLGGSERTQRVERMAKHEVEFTGVSSTWTQTALDRPRVVEPIQVQFGSRVTQQLPSYPVRAS